MNINCLANQKKEPRIYVSHEKHTCVKVTWRHGNKIKIMDFNLNILIYNSERKTRCSDMRPQRYNNLQIVFNVFTGMRKKQRFIKRQQNNVYVFKKNKRVKFHNYPKKSSKLRKFCADKQNGFNSFSRVA